MARKNVHSYTVFSAVAATSAQSNSASPTDVSQIDKCSFHCKFSASNSGTFKVYARNSKSDSFFELDFGSPLTITSESECLIDLQEVNFSDIYLDWAPSSGSGTLTTILHMSSVGA